MSVDSGATAPVPPASPAGTPPAAPVPGTDPAARAAVVPPGGAPAVPPVAPDPNALVIGDPSTPLATTPPVEGEAAGKEFKYTPTNDPALDLSLSFIGKLGIGPDHPAMVAAESGDFGMLKATLATMGDKARGWEANVALGEEAFRRVQAGHAERRAKDTAAIEAAAGGAEQWKAIKEFAAQATADAPEERASLNQMLAQGGLAAKAAASYLAQLYAAAGAAAPVKEPAKVTAGVAPTVAAAPASNALSPREYTAEVQKLYAKQGGHMNNSPEYAALKARRAQWRETR